MVVIHDWPELNQPSSNFTLHKSRVSMPITQHEPCFYNNFQKLNQRRSSQPEKQNFSEWIKTNKTYKTSQRQTHDHQNTIKDLFRYPFPCMTLGWQKNVLKSAYHTTNSQNLVKMLSQNPPLLCTEKISDEDHLLISVILTHGCLNTLICLSKLVHVKLVHRVHGLTRNLLSAPW